MIDAAALVARLRLRAADRDRRSANDMHDAADLIEHLVAQVTGWSGPQDTGVPEVKALPPRTPHESIEERLARLEAAVPNSLSAHELVEGCPRCGARVLDGRYCTDPACPV